MNYAVIDDYGDDWQYGEITYHALCYEQCLEWAEEENYHSASIVSIDEFGVRTKCNVE